MEELSIHILDVTENSVRAGAHEVRIRVRESRRENRLCIEIADDGAGMGAETLNAATDPFFTTKQTRRVGLGLPLLEQAARAAGGGLKIESSPGEGTCVTAVFELDHVDRQPLGDVGATLLTLAVGNPGVDFSYDYESDEIKTSFRTADLKARMPGVAINSLEGIAALTELLKEMTAPVQSRA